MFKKLSNTHDAPREALAGECALSSFRIRPFFCQLPRQNTATLLHTLLSHSVSPSGCHLHSRNAPIRDCSGNCSALPCPLSTSTQTTAFFISPRLSSAQPSQPVATADATHVFLRSTDVTSCVIVTLIISAQTKTEKESSCREMAVCAEFMTTFTSFHQHSFGCLIIT